MLNHIFKKKWISKSGESDWAVLAAVKAELEMRAQQFKSHQLNLTEEKNTAPTEANHDSSRLYIPLIDEPSQNPSGSLSAAVEEFETFINEPLSSLRELVDPLKPDGPTKPRRPLQYWKKNSHRFPILAAIARDVFAVSASSGSVERVFSTAKDILHAKRSRTKADLFQMPANVH
jgi:hypothetical protein